ncbi:MAG: hypothetical protein FWG45_04640 [Oscillospiraceae bacterium]|nr:hypothetical protein [Oscillospiraceae bacterium]
MNGLNTSGMNLPASINDILKDPDNVLILALIFILIKQKADKSLILALLAIMMIE